MTDKPDGAEHSDEDVDLDEFEVDFLRATTSTR